jgi:hypothetical protein
MPALKGFGIKGTVTRGGSAVKGAKLWAENVDSPGSSVEPYRKNITYCLTDSNGRYVINAANISSTVANGETIRIYCHNGDEKTFADVTITVDTVAGVTQNFALSTSLADGVRDSPLPSGEGALKHNTTRRGCVDGLS